jgi:O-antigen/teichoic acid export membrane protein
MLALALPIMLLSWSLRRAFYLESRTAEAARTSAVYAAVLMVLAVALKQLDWLSSWSPLAAIGLANLASSVVAWHRLGLRAGVQLLREELSAVRVVIQRHWGFGRWNVVRGVLALGINYVQIFLVAALIGIDSAGVLRALLLLILPIGQIIAALGVFTTPILAAEYGRNGALGLKSKGYAIAAVLVGMAATYELLLIFGGQTLERVLFGGQHRDQVWLIAILGLVPIFNAIDTAAGLMLRAAEKTLFYLIDGIVSATVGLLSALILTWIWGIDGAVISVALTAAAGGLLVWWLQWRWLSPRDDAPQRAAQTADAILARDV